MIPFGGTLPVHSVHCAIPCSMSIMIPGTAFHPGTLSAKSINGVRFGLYAESITTPPSARVRIDAGIVTPAEGFGKNSVAVPSAGIVEMIAAGGSEGKEEREVRGMMLYSTGKEATILSAFARVRLKR